MNILDSIRHEGLRDDVPEFGVGDTVKVQVKVREGGKTRLQLFQWEKMASLGVLVFQMSLDGLEQTHDRFRSEGSFKRTLAAMQRCPAQPVTEATTFSAGTSSCISWAGGITYPPPWPSTSASRVASTRTSSGVARPSVAPNSAMARSRGFTTLVRQWCGPFSGWLAHHDPSATESENTPTP